MFINICGPLPLLVLVGFLALAFGRGRGCCALGPGWSSPRPAPPRRSAPAAAQIKMFRNKISRYFYETDKDIQNQDPVCSQKPVITV